MMGEKKQRQQQQQQLTDLSERQKDRKKQRKYNVEEEERKRRRRRRRRQQPEKKPRRRSSPVSLFVLFACVEPRGGALVLMGFSVLAGAQTISRTERKKGSISDTTTIVDCTQSSWPCTAIVHSVYLLRAYDCAMLISYVD